MKPAVGAGNRLKQNSMVISQLQRNGLVGTDTNPVVDLFSADVCVKLVHSLGDPGALSAGLLVWENKGGLRYTLPTFGHVDLEDHLAVADVVTKILHAGAFHNRSLSSWLQVEPSDLPIITALMSLGLVRMEGGKCSLTELALQPGVMHTHWRLSDPKPALAVRDHLPLADRSCYELLVGMFAAGWTWAARPPGNKGLPIGYKPGDTMTFYSAGRTLPSVQYLQALLRADEPGSLGSNRGG